MSHLPASNPPMIEEEDATGDIARIYAEVKRELQIPYVPNWAKALAVSPVSLNILWDLQISFLRNTMLPQSLTAMILYTAAETANCEYCSALNELSCRTLGVDDEMLTALVKDLGNVSPERIRAIIEFALKAARNAQLLDAADYERLREQGITDEEIVEILLVAGIGNLNHTLTDALKIEVDSVVAGALGHQG
jgi:uncharacterized peroxidase-related enzyme